MALFTSLTGDLDGYVGASVAPAEAAFYGDTGNPSFGCAMMHSVSPQGAQIANTTQPYVLTTDAPRFYFNGRFVSDIDISGDFINYIFQITVNFSAGSPVSMIYTGDGLFSSGTNSGWLQFNILLSGHTIGQSITSIYFDLLVHPTATLTAYIDSFSLGTIGREDVPEDEQSETGTPLFFATLPPIRFLGMATDNTNLYVTSIYGTHLALTVYTSTLAISSHNATSFGTADYTEPDTYTRAIYPATKRDNQVYVYGRDGNNKQVRFKDGTAAWVDAGAGTAAWTTSKFAVALLGWPVVPNDVIVVFRDDDIYRTEYGTANWVQIGDAPSQVGYAARSDFEGQKLLIGGTTTMTHYTQNYGESFADGGTVDGTVYAIEFSL